MVVDHRTAREQHSTHHAVRDLHGLLGPLLLGPTPRSVALWLTIAALLAGNSVFHARATLRMREYSPGLVTALLFYLPLAVLGFTYFLRAGEASVGTAVSAALIGVSYSFISTFNHRRRARRGLEDLGGAPRGLRHSPLGPGLGPYGLRHSDLGMRRSPRFVYHRDAGPNPSSRFLHHSPRRLNDAGAGLQRSPREANDADRGVHHSDPGLNDVSRGLYVPSRGENVRQRSAVLQERSPISGERVFVMQRAS